MTPNPVARGSQLTITGTNLDLVTGIVLKGVADTIKTFVSQSAAQIVITIPQEASFGQITLYSLAGVPCLSADPLTYVGDPVQLPPLGLALYENGAYQNGFSYGWWLSTTPDPNSTDIINVGTTASLKVTFDGGWSGAVFNNNGVSISDYSTFQMSFYGGPGTDGIQFQVDFNSGTDNIAFTVAEGKWTNVSMPVSTWTSLSSGTVTMVQIQDRGTGGVVYFDRIGFGK
jgi:hypothetical protein